MTTGAKESHPCAGCSCLDWSETGEIHYKYTIDVPVCKKGDWAVPVARCDAYEYDNWREKEDKGAADN